jgi:hypothetical protein
MAILEAAIQEVLNQGVGLGILGPLLDSTSGEFFRIVIPKVATQSTANRAARLVTGIEVEAQLAGAVHKVEATINAQV